MPDAVEIEKVVFKLNADSACGPEGFNRSFYQSCWDIVGPDIIQMIHAFFQGATLPKSVTHTNLVLIPKKDIIHSSSDLRPISVSNSLNKVISRLVHDRIESFLPKLISENQSGFVKGRNISENVLLAQEVISDIRLRGRQSRVEVLNQGIGENGI